MPLLIVLAWVFIPVYISAGVSVEQTSCIHIAWGTCVCSFITYVQTLRILGLSLLNASAVTNDFHEAVFGVILKEWGCYT